MTDLKPISLQLRRCALLVPAALLLEFAVLESARAATIGIGNVTTSLGPTFFVDDAATGGDDVTVTQPGVGSYIRNFAGLLNTNQGPTPPRILPCSPWMAG